MHKEEALAARKEAEWKEARIWILIVVAILVLLFVPFVLQPYFEAKTFNKFKKPEQQEATYWDALFSNLRVETE